MIQITVRRIGNSLGVILPAEALRALQAKQGDKLYLTDMQGGLGLTRYDPELAEQLEANEECMRDYGNALRELGK